MSTNGLPNRAVLGLAASLALASCFYLSKSHNSGDKIIESPLSQVLALTQTEQERLSFPPDVVPGARDMSTPYGSIRVHEWGPEDGRRMLLVHGISTPGIALYSVADELVKNGCRVMFHGRSIWLSVALVAMSHVWTAINIHILLPYHHPCLGGRT